MSLHEKRGAGFNGGGHVLSYRDRSASGCFGPPTLRKSQVVKRLIGSQKQAESKAGQTLISRGGDTFMKSEKPCRGGLTNYE
jgi:hypothetical protein